MKPINSAAIKNSCDPAPNCSEMFRGGDVIFRERMVHSQSHRLRHAVSRRHREREEALGRHLFEQGAPRGAMARARAQKETSSLAKKLGNSVKNDGLWEQHSRLLIAGVLF